MEKEELIGLLRRRKLLSWIFLEREERKHNLYCTKDGEVEDYIFGSKKEHLLILHRRMDGKVGSATISLDMSLPEKEILRKIADAEFSASVALNKAYVPLESYDGYPSVSQIDPFYLKEGEKGFRKKLDSMRESFLKSLSKHEGVKLASLEIFFKETSSNLTTSLGKTLAQRRSENMIYGIVLFGNGSDEKEFSAMRTECRIDDLDPMSFADYLAETVKSASLAIQPARFEGDIILSREAVTDFFTPLTQENPLILHAFARLKHLGISRYKDGERIADFKGDAISIASNPLLPFGLDTLRYDVDTVPARRIALIENGVFRNRIAGKMYADYLSIAPSGPLGNIEVASGSKGENEIYSGKKAYEIVAFSWFNPNFFSGEFSAEIRMGYIIENGKRTPFKGGALTGNVFKMIENAYYSKERMKTGSYFGPRCVLFKDMVVFGEDQ